MSYKPFLISELQSVRVGTKVRVLGELEKLGGRAYLKDPFSDARIPLTRTPIGDIPEGLVEVFGTLTPYGLSVDFILEANADPREYVEVIREEREKLLWFNERSLDRPKWTFSRSPARIFASGF